MFRLSGWLLLLGGGLSAYLLHQYEQKNGRLPGAVGSLPNNPNLPAGVNAQLGYSPLDSTAGVATGLSLPASSADQQSGLLTLDPDSDVGASPGTRAQTEAAYNQGANSMGNPTGPDENQNDEDGLNSLFSFD